MKSLYALPLLGLLALPAQAATTVAWTNWEPGDDASTAVGSIWTGDHFVTVTATNTAAYAFVQTGGTPDFWVPDAYTNGSVANAPDSLDTDIVALDGGGTVTFTFSEAVAEVFFAFVSWNGQPEVTFSQQVALDSEGAGYWGTGSGVSISGNTVDFGAGEAHGVLTLGATSGFSFTSGTENWHGFTLGITPVPVPASAPLLLGAMGAVAAFRRKRKA